MRSMSDAISLYSSVHSDAPLGASLDAPLGASLAPFGVATAPLDAPFDAPLGAPLDASEACSSAATFPANERPSV